MAKSRKQDSTKPPASAGTLAQKWLAPYLEWINSPTGRLAPFIAVIVLVGGGTYSLWNHYAAEIARTWDDHLKVENVVIPPQPTWIHSDVRAQSLRDASLLGASIREPDITVRVARAFELNSWVAKVRRVSKYHPARLVVELEYRRPVAMVAYWNDQKDKWYVFPVDSNGVILPTEDFLDPADQARHDLVTPLPRLEIPGAYPTGPPGTLCGDTRVVGGAQIAAALFGQWQKLGLYRIVASDPKDLTGWEETVYRLETQKGAGVTWGRAPGSEIPGEPKSAKKLERLARYVQQMGPLDLQQDALDLRSAPTPTPLGLVRPPINR